MFLNDFIYRSRPWKWSESLENSPQSSHRHQFSLSSLLRTALQGNTPFHTTQETARNKNFIWKWIIFNHFWTCGGKGRFFRRSLRSLVSSYLKRDIQVIIIDERTLPTFLPVLISSLNQSILLLYHNVALLIFYSVLDPDPGAYKKVKNFK